MELSDLFNLIASLILSGTGIWATFYFAKANKEREDDKMMKELFTEFNSQYGKLNNKLELAVKEDSIDDLSDELKGDVIDFFNLCAEEHFWNKKHRIDKRVWKSWSVGMNYWYNHESGIIKELWGQETKDRGGLMSYYIENGDEFFKEENG